MNKETNFGIISCENQKHGMNLFINNLQKAHSDYKMYIIVIFVLWQCWIWREKVHPDFTSLTRQGYILIKFSCLRAPCALIVITEIRPLVQCNPGVHFTLVYDIRHTKTTWEICLVSHTVVQYYTSGHHKPVSDGWKQVWICSCKWYCWRVWKVFAVLENKGTK